MKKNIQVMLGMLIIAIIIFIGFLVYTIGYNKGELDTIMEITNTGQIPMYIDNLEDNITIRVVEKLSLETIIKKAYNDGGKDGYEQCIIDVRSQFNVN